MDQRQVSVARPFLPAAANTLDDEQLLDRLGAYWEALGVSDTTQASQLAARTLQRLHNRPGAPGLSLLEQAIAAAGALLDDWLMAELALQRRGTALAAARAALLSGAVPADWPAALLAGSGMPAALREALRAAQAVPVPAARPAVMPTQRISLFSLLGPLRRLARPTSST
ncbi:MAG TPA: hypothetical protein PLE42_00390 [Candidatus Competibacteraceae bacterium]|nr:MAG: hypothetical protein EKK69_01980 [Candidatus Competibacteraceae bacterium]HQC71159.1 hypothetical protein [Candidatus Competibacteraceae bacterium]